MPHETKRFPSRKEKSDDEVYSSHLLLHDDAAELQW